MNLTDHEYSEEYADIFLQRGHLYHAAMASARQVRDLEFGQLFARTPCAAAERIIDAPSGGAYLQDFLRRTRPDAGCEIINLEFAPGFSDTPLVVDPYGDWPVPAHWADRAICLAASHHIVNLLGLLDNFHRVTRPGALIQLADVEPASGIARFLDEFVDRYTTTGHQGIYRNFHGFDWPSWMDICSIETRPCPWRFDSEHHMLQFCSQLFGLSESAIPVMGDALAQFVGYAAVDQGVELQWRLVYVDALRR